MQFGYAVAARVAGPQGARLEDHQGAGHPEGYQEGFAQLDEDGAEQLHARLQGRMPDPRACWMPTVEGGLLDMKFIDAVVESSRDNGRWVDARNPR